MSTYSTQWQEFASTDIDEVQSSVSVMIKPHRLSQQYAHQNLCTRLRCASFGRTSVLRLGYGAHVRIQPEELNSFYLVQLPQYGHATVQSGKEIIDSSPHIATILNPNAKIDMTWHANNEQLMLKIDRSLIEDIAVSMGLHIPESGLVFPTKFEGHQLARWKVMQRYILDCAYHLEDLLKSPLLLAQIEELMARTLLELHPPKAQENPRYTREVLPKYIKLVENYLHEHANQPIKLHELATIAQVSIRTLHARFQEYYGISPMHYLRQIRLDRVRHELLHNNQTELSISEIALRWGFMHHGRFSAEFKQRFGESPSQFIHRRR